MKVKAAVLVASDSRSSNSRADKSGPIAAKALEEAGFDVVETVVTPDDRDAIGTQLAAWCDRSAADLVITSGGTGLSPRDVTPEATCDVLDRQAPGIAEFLRLRSLEVTPHAALSRGVAGIRGQTLIINLPGSPRAVRESLVFLEPLLHHALETLLGRAHECGR